jgi:hypothetical protein
VTGKRDFYLVKGPFLKSQGIGNFGFTKSLRSLVVRVFSAIAFSVLLNMAKKTGSGRLMETTTERPVSASADIGITRAGFVAESTAVISGGSVTT